MPERERGLSKQNQSANRKLNIFSQTIFFLRRNLFYFRVFRHRFHSLRRLAVWPYACGEVKTTKDFVFSMVTNQEKTRCLAVDSVKDRLRLVIDF